MALRAIVAGVGSRGRDWVREIRASESYELVGCVDTEPQALQEAFQHKTDFQPPCFTSLDAALQESGCDVVIVATPADCHFETCRLALSKGKAVLVEKPFTLQLSEAVRLVTLARQQGAPLLVAQNYRYLRSFRTARLLIREGRLGRVGLVIFQYYRVPHQMAQSLARLTHSVLWGVGVHHLDSLRYVLGSKVINVLAESFTLPWGELPRGASLQVMLSLDDGARAVYSATYESSGHEFFERGQEFYARFVGERATLHIFQRWLLLCEKGKLPRLIRRGARKITEEQVLLGQLERAIEGIEVPDSSGEDNLETVAIVEACVNSANEKRWVNPQELLDAK